MPTYVAFLRAINLGPRRRFAMDAVRAATEAAGGREVDTHLATGNVRLHSPRRSADRLAEALEEAYREAAGFTVATVVVPPAELRRVAADAEEIGAGLPGPVATQYVSFLRTVPTAEAVAALEARSGETEHVVVRGRAAHLALAGDYHTATLTNALVERHLGVATNRNLSVIRALVERWCAG